MTRSSFDWSPDQARLITGCDDGFVRLWDGTTGALLAPPFRHPGPFRTYEGALPPIFGDYVPDRPVAGVDFDDHSGRRALSAAAFGGIELYELAPVRPSLEPWFLDFSEAIVGKRFNERGVLEGVPVRELLMWREELSDEALAALDQPVDPCLYGCP